jgi:hypothetical protein
MDRIIERNGYRAEIIGASTNCQLWINGVLYGTFQSIRAARVAFASYWQRRK